MVFLQEQLEFFLGQEVRQVRGDAPAVPPALLIGQPLTGILTFGKELLCCFPGFVLRLHLMLFGKYVINGTLNRPLRLGLTFETGEVNFYACACELLLEPLDQRYDWRRDVLHPAFDEQQALAKLQSKPRRLVCDALLDQDILAGVGNGIKNEALFRAQVHPASLVGALPEARLQQLIRACRQVSQDYLAWLREETAGPHWQVYRQRECPRDHIPLRQEKVGRSNRSCYFCERCQQLYLPDGG